jgi:GH15 family glucan-1,4-alpha-glucosidase
VTLRIEDYAVVGDLQTAALVGRDGSLDWLCLPRFDSPACCSALLDAPRAGRWLLAPAAGGTATSRSYVQESLVLEQVWETASGAVRVLDLMPPRGTQPDVVRIVEGLRGTVEMTTELVARFDYGRVLPWVRRQQGRWTAVGGPDALWLDTPVRLQGRDHSTVAHFPVRAGERVPFVLTWAPSYEQAPEPVDAEQALQDTLVFWSDWLRSCTAGGPYAAAVRRSLVVLKALTYAPTGGIAAAVTTSLPEQIGGVRNWDYRYCWLRDASFTLQALAGGGYTGEARAWRDWLLRAVAGDPDQLQIMYTVTGRRRMPEEDLEHLSGYEDSRPVRVGNAAAGQFQLDVWGEVLDALSTARDAGLGADEDAWALQCLLTEHLEKVWREPDSSLWEVRGPRRQYVHSKVMAWVGFDRMIRTAERSGLPGPVERWREARDAVHADVCAHGFDARRGTFTQFYGSQGLDAALLLLPRLGFLPPDDERVIGTVEAVQRELCEDGFVLRYRVDRDPVGEHGTADGVPGEEGAFLACSFWLADALALLGRRDEAVALFERLLALSNDVGLLSEEWDPHTGRQLGNTPQAFSHVALVNTALALQRGAARLPTEVEVRARTAPSR